MSILVRPAETGDLFVVMDFNSRLAAESEGKVLDQAILRPGVAAVLEDAHKGRYFLAEMEGNIVGQLAITYEWSDWRNGWFWWIQSVYVQIPYRRKGVFRALFNHVQEAAGKEPDVIGLRLYVESDNRIAHQTYQDLGLKWTGYRLMEKFPLGRLER